ncbi:MAG TPA: TetR/AcrR family transcriptional regulator C-terminal domain-containing protein [Trebonia sp.]|nr:TetR/AcrR family transcriptional regulator C-terminal domain-containing protein [Trebonia sp.]
MEQTPAKRTRADRAGLSREQVLDAALDLVDREGVAALSMRRLGAELGVEAMTLYHYLPNKDALLDGIVERVMAQAQTGLTDGPWERALTDYARSLRATLLRHPGASALVATRPAVTPETLRAAERGLALLTGAGFPVGRALDTLNALTLFTVAHAASEAATAAVNRTAAAGSQDYLAALDDREFPLIAEAARTSAGTDDAARFEFAVAAFLRGVAVSG